MDRGIRPHSPGQRREQHELAAAAGDVRVRLPRQTLVPLLEFTFQSPLALEHSQRLSVRPRRRRCCSRTRTR